MNELNNANDFEIIAKEKTVEFLKVDEGYHIGRCISIILCGTQMSEFKGVKRQREEVIFEFELPERPMVYDEVQGKMIFSDGKGSKPYTIRNIYSLSLSEKSNLSKDLEDWRGVSFTSKERQSFNVCQMIGTPAYLTIRNKMNEATGESYPRITHLQPLMPGQECPVQRLENQILTFAKWDQEVFNNLSKWTKSKIAASPEFIQLVLDGKAETYQ